MISITTRADKGSPLTNAEVDGNFTNLKAGVEGAVSAIATETTARIAADGAVVDQIEAQYGVADGVATLDMDGKVPDAQVRKYAYANLAAFPATGAAGAIYIAQDTGKLYRWVSAGVYAELAPSPDEVQQYADLAAFPVSGAAGTLYIAADTGLVYRWDGAAYAPVGLQPIADQTVLGNVSGSTATPVALTQAQVKTLVNHQYLQEAASGTQVILTPVDAGGTKAALYIRVGTTGNLVIEREGSLQYGSTRGAHAVDLQMDRSVSSAVASGPRSGLLCGYNNEAQGTNAVVVGGQSNYARQQNVFIGGGNNNTADGAYDAICGGHSNDTSSRTGTNPEFIGGGYSNLTSSGDSVVAGGYDNAATGSSSAVGGGYLNTASGAQAVISGGRQNTASANWAAVLGGLSNTAAGQYTVVCGGNTNTTGASSHYTFIGGGFSNNATGTYGVICGGYDNTITGADGAILWGYACSIAANRAVILSGYSININATAQQSVAVQCNNTQGAVINYPGQVVRVISNFQNNADTTCHAVAYDVTLCCRTVDGTATVMGDGMAGSNAVLMSADSQAKANSKNINVIEATVTASDGADIFVKVFRFIGQSTGPGTFAQVGSTAVVDSYNSAGAATWSVSPHTLSPGAGSFSLIVQGEAGKTVTWHADLRVVRQSR